VNQHRPRRVLDEQRVQPVGGPGVVPFGSRGEDRAELGSK